LKERRMDKRKRKKFSFSLPGLSISSIRFGKIRIPNPKAIRIPMPGGLYLGGGKLVVGSLSAVGLGFVAALFLVISTGDQEITWPMLGAQYTAPSMIGDPVVDAEFPEEQSQTLQLNLPHSLRLSTIEFSDIRLGKFGLATAFQITGYNSTTSRLVIEDLTIRNSEFRTMDFANADIYQFNATSSVAAAGHTFSPTMSTTTSNVIVGSDRGAASYSAEDMVVDRIIIKQTTEGADVVIGSVILDNVRTWEGAFDLDYVEIGTLTLENVRVGDDGDLEDPDLIVNTTVSVAIMSDGVKDERIEVR